MKEISRRVKSNSSEGVACGPVSIYAIDAEIVVEDEGKEIFLHAQYVSESPDILFEAHTKSIYDVYMELNKIDASDNEAFNTAIAKRDALDAEERVSDDLDIYERYADQYRELRRMIKDTMIEDDMYDESFDEEFDDDDYEGDEEE